MRISMMMAMDTRNLIGKEGGMPWHISSDLQYFKRVTMGKPVIMGRVTYDSIGRPLPGRANIVVTRNNQWSVDGVRTAASLHEAYDVARTQSAEEMMVIGGASLCQAAMPDTERLYLTVIDHEFPDGDTWLDSFNWQDWTVTSVDKHDETADGGYRFAYYVLDRKS